MDNTYAHQVALALSEISDTLRQIRIYMEQIATSLDHPEKDDGS